MLTNTVTSIPVSYETDNHNIKLSLTFGEGQDGDVFKNEEERKSFSKNYDVEVFESGEGEDYAKGYRVICNDNPLVIKIGDISIKDGSSGSSSSSSSKYEYAIGFAVDGDEPEYQSGFSTIPKNIERDGTMWTIPANNGGSYNLDQNPNATYQWMAKRSLEQGYKPTAEELELGMEETTENTGLIYLTFMVFRKLKYVEEPVTRGGGTTRCISRGATRGSSGSGSSGSVGARFGYGNEATSASVKTTFEYAEGTEKYVLPIRLRIAEDSVKTDINCSKHLKGASLNTLRRQTMKVPF
jgi:hypothetical protein